MMDAIQPDFGYDPLHRIIGSAVKAIESGSPSIKYTVSKRYKTVFKQHMHHALPRGHVFSRKLIDDTLSRIWDECISAEGHQFYTEGVAEHLNGDEESFAIRKVLGPGFDSVSLDLDHFLISSDQRMQLSALLKIWTQSDCTLLPKLRTEQDY
jgi:hypothetical protein